MHHGIVTVTIVLAAILAAASTPVVAQVTTCATSNCSPGNAGVPNLPQGCLVDTGERVALPRFLEVQMGPGGQLRFSIGNTGSPGGPVRIEGDTSASGPWTYQCIQWHDVDTLPLTLWHSATEDDGGSTCATSMACSSTNITPNPCSFDTGNVDHAPAGLEFSTCHYRDIVPATYSFRCRRHQINGMTGDLTVVAPIVLSAIPGAGATDVDLSWTGGSASGPWDVYRENSTNAQKMANPALLTPAAGQSATRTLTDACSPVLSLCTYMVRECNRISGSQCAGLIP